MKINKNSIIGLFVLIALIQVFVPLSMISKREDVLKNGQAFKFRVQPVDPYDAFRGRYVAVSLKEDSIKPPDGLKLNRGQEAFVQITVNQDGFAHLGELTLKKPEDTAYIKVEVGYVSKNKVNCDLPIDRYYMEEESAPKAERLYRKHSNEEDAYLIVKVKDGLVVIENLYVKGQKIEDLIKQELKEE